MGLFSIVEAFEKCGSFQVLETLGVIRYRLAGELPEKELQLERMAAENADQAALGDEQIDQEINQKLLTAVQKAIRKIETRS